MEHAKHDDILDKFTRPEIPEASYSEMRVAFNDLAKFAREQAVHHDAWKVAQNGDDKPTILLRDYEQVYWQREYDQCRRYMDDEPRLSSRDARPKWFEWVIAAIGVYLTVMIFFKAVLIG